MAAEKQNNRISAHFKRICKRQGKKKARIATAHLVLTIVYHILKTGKPYEELGEDYLKDNDQSRDLKMIRHLKKKGYTVLITEHESA